MMHVSSQHQIDRINLKGLQQNHIPKKAYRTNRMTMATYFAHHPRTGGTKVMLLLPRENLHSTGHLRRKNTHESDCPVHKNGRKVYEKN